MLFWMKLQPFPKFVYLLWIHSQYSQPDQNYAREFMQLYTIGLDMLDEDGSVILKDGRTVQTYDTTDVQTFARAW